MSRACAHVGPVEIFTNVKVVDARNRRSAYNLDDSLHIFAREDFQVPKERVKLLQLT